ncbi:MAG TPA: BadF/BadG/BcrA/BcrD ATPase family protein [Candidatus Limnocylindria bacterium]
MRRPPAAVLAVDGGNSKADVAIVARDGRLLAAVRGPTVSHQQVGLREGVARLRALVAEAARRAGLPARGEGPVAELGMYCVAGADFRRDVSMLTSAFADSGLTRRTEVLNDTLAPLRAGTERGWGVVLICGAGVNAAAVGASGRTARLAALGPISGDQGGGRDLGMGALGAAVRARDGRGPRTTLERLVPAHFHLARPAAVTRAMYDGRIEEERVRELARVVFAAAQAGDAVARGLVDRLADELAIMAIAMIRRVGIARREFDVVLAGGVFLNHDPAFLARLTAAIQRVAPGARPVPLRAPPLLGAALLGLDRLTPPPGRAAERKLRAAFAVSGTPARV